MSTDSKNVLEIGITFRQIKVLPEAVFCIIQLSKEQTSRSTAGNMNDAGNEVDSESVLVGATAPAASTASIRPTRRRSCSCVAAALTW